MNASDIPAMIVFAVLAYIWLSIIDAPKHKALCDYVQKVAMKQWMEWMREYERTGRWN